MDSAAIVALLTAAVVVGTPLLYAAMGELLTERSGILNLGVEGMMLVGAVLGFMITVNTGNYWYGILAAMFGGGMMAAIHAFISVTLRGNQVVSGLALTIFGTGVSGFMGKPYQGVNISMPFDIINIPVLSKIPVLGPVFFSHNILVYASILIALVLWYILYRTRWGLTIRSVGENPAAADAVGISVSRVRYLCTITGGILAGLAGAYLSLAYAPSWQENMTAGRGWIAVALVIFALWNPLRAILGSYLFGGVEALTFRLQATGVTISPFFLSMFPYILTVLVLVIVTIRLRQEAGAPTALATPYDREER
ncbi:MAG: ABC transporter permease [Syntrophomonadaceae bacterium]|nr:ABC transporter permease [Syntrophomonadaceae bacterium]MDD3889515.1 ABC transporter permease [Syntrophomonadaceae bacterium]MDD4548767.1 ABC transporter permease [Syntrophomonadaceae bacterium]